MIIADIIIAICLFVLFTSIIINFVEKNEKKILYKKKSIVETGTMTAFFLFFYTLIRFRIGNIGILEYRNIPIFQNIVGFNFLKNIFLFFGTLFVVIGTFINILGRFNLGKNWANQIEIYKNQTLVMNGIYKYVRHPLYASIILMFYGAAMVHLNYYAFLINTFVFIPFMYYRAKQEELLLNKKFKEYEFYKKVVGMFFPKIKKC